MYEVEKEEEEDQVFSLDPMAPRDNYYCKVLFYVCLFNVKFEMKLLISFIYNIVEYV